MDKNLETSKDEMRELIFSIVEETSNIEQSLEQIKLDIDSIKKSANSSLEFNIETMQNTINTILEEQNRQKDLLANINGNDFNLIKDEVLDNKRVKNLENKINNLEQLVQNGGVNLKHLSLAKEKSRWQMASIAILIFLICESIYFFGFIFDGTITGHFMYLSSTIPYLFIMYAINIRMQKISVLMQEEKR